MMTFEYVNVAALGRRLTMTVMTTMTVTTTMTTKMTIMATIRVLGFARRAGFCGSRLGHHEIT